MKGVKIGLKEGIVIFVALIVMANYIGFFYAGIIVVALLGFNAYLRNKEKKMESENTSTEQQK